MWPWVAAVCKAVELVRSAVMAKLGNTCKSSFNTSARIFIIPFDRITRENKTSMTINKILLLVFPKIYLEFLPIKLIFKHNNNYNLQEEDIKFNYQVFKLTTLYCEVLNCLKQSIKKDSNTHTRKIAYKLAHDYHMVSYIPWNPLKREGKKRLVMPCGTTSENSNVSKSSKRLSLKWMHLCKYGLGSNWKTKEICKEYWKLLYILNDHF